MTDLEYSQQGMFTRFYANTLDGEDAWREMAKESGAAAVLNFEAKRIISQLRSAGYTVAKAKKSPNTIDSILAELVA